MIKNFPTAINHLILVIGLLVMIIPVWIIFASSTHTSVFINTNGLQFFFRRQFFRKLFKSFI